MVDHILQELKIVNTLSVNTALWVFRRGFDILYSSASTLPLEQIDEWVNESNILELEQYWRRQIQRKYPHLFLYGMLWYYKFDILKKAPYQRESSENVLIPNSKKDYGDHRPVVEHIIQNILPLPFYESIAFLGRLIGGWMLTCPEAIIRSEHKVEEIGEWQTRKKTTDWEVPIPWICTIYPGDPTAKVRDKEVQLLFVLDSCLHFAFDDYDMANVV